MMKTANSQYGVTLLEVLVGFVIFSASLVAVLDYVSGQVYNFHRSASNLQKVQLAYDWSTAHQALANTGLQRSNLRGDADITVSSSTMEVFTWKKREISLNRYSYRVADPKRSNSNNTLAWTVIRVNWIMDGPKS
jgi:Tfp pilus assembly protein PilV